MLTYSLIATQIGHILVAASAKGICAVRMGSHSELVEQAFLDKFSNRDIHRDPAVMKQVTYAITDYMTGSRRNFNFPLELRGSEFEMRVWAELAKIPFGETRSYTDIAIAIGNVKAVRAVANACGDNPVPILIPCHRVIQKDGGLGGFSPGIEFKKKLLAIEQPLPNLLSPPPQGHAALH